MDEFDRSIPLVSIIMPAYNCANFINEAVDSVIRQSYRNWELIIIDDCSKDNTPEIIDNILRIDSRIKFYNNNINSGVAFTRNKGVDLASGEWIAFLDSDDLWEITKLEKQINIACKLSLNFVFTGSSFINENSLPYKWILRVPEKVSFKQLLKQNIISCSSVLIKKNFISKYKMERDDTHEDFGSWLRILKEEPYAYGIDEPLLIYRISANSKSGNKIKSLKMAYKTYLFAGINPIQAIYYMMWYIVRGIKKQKSIRFDS